MSNTEQPNRPDDGMKSRRTGTSARRMSARVELPGSSSTEARMYVRPGRPCALASQPPAPEPSRTCENLNARAERNCSPQTPHPSKRPRLPVRDAGRRSPHAVAARIGEELPFYLAVMASARMTRTGSSARPPISSQNAKRPAQRPSSVPGNRLDGMLHACRESPRHNQLPCCARRAETVVRKRAYLTARRACTELYRCEGA
ncbi:hypothetical protein C8Q73DRAFT_75589 [Cubamyces lactineus]|nr:hypothetical protein C8Q73DRAFT_75589 [Cubamyces lactineus]